MTDPTAALACEAAGNETEVENLSNMTLEQLALAIRKEFGKLKREKIGQYLVEAKRKITRHGEFMEFVKKNLPGISHHTATNWMKLAGADEEVEGHERESNKADRAEKKREAALKLLAEMTSAEAERLDLVHLERLGRRIMPLVPSSEERLGGGNAVGSLVAYAQRVVDWAKIPGVPPGIDCVKASERAVLKEALEILSGYVTEYEAAA